MEKINFDKTSVSILTQVVYKQLRGNEPTPPNKDFWDLVKNETLELARTILRTEKSINPLNK